MYAISWSESRLLNPYSDEGRDPKTRSVRALSITASSGKVYQFSIPRTKMNPHESKRLSPGGPDPKHH